MIGALSISDDVGRVFEAEHIQLAQTFVHQAALAMENAQLFAEIQEGRDRLRTLSRQLLETQETERQHLARELHDEAGQALTALKINLELLQAEVAVGPPSLRQRFGEAVALTTETLEGIRRLAHALRPPLLETLGLSASLEGLCTEFGRQTHLAVTYESTEIPGVPEEVTLCLYRCLQESLTNVAKHGCAKHVWVTLHWENATLSLSVEDNGQGFDTQAARAARPGSTGMGLLGIRERLELLEGWMEIESTPGRGTSLTMYLPLQEAL
ncbi:MAG: sensor histidine kinase [Nitrospinae bacterium]|nr:sensor histidine kinase [Nitrospinota bacterium]